MRSDSFTALDALIASSGTSSLLPSSDKAPHVRAICLFDNEEVGSVSYQGAESSLLPGFVERIAAIDGFWGKTGMDVGTLMANSFLISSDMGHAVSRRRRLLTGIAFAKSQSAHGSSRLMCSSTQTTKANTKTTTSR